MIREFREKHDVVVCQGWGMTEMSPLGTANALKAGMEDLPPDEMYALQTKAGRGIFGCELRIVDAEGEHRARLTLGQAYARRAGVEHDVFNAGDAELAFIEVEIKAHGLDGTE